MLMFADFCRSMFDFFCRIIFYDWFNSVEFVIKMKNRQLLSGKCVINYTVTWLNKESFCSSNKVHLVELNIFCVHHWIQVDCTIVLENVAKTEWFCDLFSELGVCDWFHSKKHTLIFAISYCYTHRSYCYRISLLYR